MFVLAVFCLKIMRMFAGRFKSTSSTPRSGANFIAVFTVGNACTARNNANVAPKCDKVERKYVRMYQMLGTNYQAF